MVLLSLMIKFVQTNKEKLIMSGKEEDNEKASKEIDYDEDNKDQLEEEQEEKTREQETTNQVF